MKRSYFGGGGGMGYGDSPLPSKISAASCAWPDYSQDDFKFGMGDDGHSMFGVGKDLSFESGSSNWGRSGPQGAGMSRCLDRLKTMFGDYSSGYSSQQHDSSYPSVRFSGFGQGSGNHDHGYNEGGGFNEGRGYDSGEGYKQNYKYNYGFGEQEWDWGYNQSGRNYYGGGDGPSFGGGHRGQGRGQGRGEGRGQGQSRGRGGQGRAQVGGRGQPQGFGSQGQVNRGRGRGQQGNYQGNNTVPQRGRGGGNFGGNNFGGYGSQNNNMSSNQQNQRGRGGQTGGQGNSRGKGGGGGSAKGPTASRVKSISDNLSSLVTSGNQGQGRGVKGMGSQRGRGGASGKPTTLMDLVDTARQRKLGNGNSSYSEEENRLAQFVEFFTTCPERVNGIQTLSNALSASRLNLKMEFEAEELIFITKPLFTGVLTLGGFFLTRGLGLNKKSVKHDCFQRAVELLRSMTVDEILKLEDCGKEALREEVQHQSEADFESFKSFLCTKQNSSSMSETDSLKVDKKQETKKQQKQAAEMETSEKIRTAAVSVSQGAERNFPLSDKMMMLVKEIEKSDMKEADVAMASRFDVLCFKVGISVTALFRAVDPSNARRFHTQPYKGDPDLDLICEIYYDGVQVGKGQGKPRKEAQVAAYSNIRSRLLEETISAIVQGPKLHSQPESLPDYFEIIYKGVKPMEGNNHSRLFSLKVYPPDLSKPVDELVIIETEGETIEDNAYKILEFSASKNGMLLEWKYLDKVPTVDGFRCEITLNRQKSVTGMGPSKTKSRNNTAAMILMELYQSQDVISFSNKDDSSKAIPMSDFVKRAEELKVDGPARVDRVECPWPDSTTKAMATDKETTEDGASSSREWLGSPMRLWLEDAIVEAMEAYRKKVTLEELMFGPALSEGMLRFCRAAARHCFLTPPSVRPASSKEMVFFFFHHRGVTPQEMVKILHVCKNTSGRYTLVRANKPFSVMQQAQFVRMFPDEWLARARNVQESEKLKREEEGSRKVMVEPSQ